MALLLLTFSVLFLLAFAVVFAMLRTPAGERAIAQRLAAVQPWSGGPARGAELPFREKPSATLGVTSWFKTRRSMHRLEALVYQSTGVRSAGATLLAMAGAGLVGMAVVLFLTRMPPLAGLAGILLGTLPLLRLHRLKQRRVKAFETALPDCIDMCARALRAGHSLVAAIGMLAEEAPEPARTEFAEIFRKQNYGLPIREAFLETLERVPSADLRVLVTGILVQKDTGGNLTEIFDRIVLVIRERIRIQGEIRVHTTQGRLTGWILTILPVALLLVINVINPGYSQPLFTEPLGRKLIYAGIVCLMLGALTIRRIVNGIEV